MLNSGGEKTGSSPVDRGKPGVKYTLSTDKKGVPLVLKIEGANESDHKKILPSVADSSEVGGLAPSLGWCLPMLVMIVGRPKKFSAASESRQRFVRKVPLMVVTLGEFAGLLSARLAGSRDFVDQGVVTIGLNLALLAGQILPWQC